MSNIIKSDKTVSASFGSAGSISASYETLYAAYKSRVEADGGIVVDEATTLSTFEKIVSMRVYGNFNTFVSAKFGVKQSEQGITKLYALDGVDLIATTFGSGLLPVIQDGAIKFRNSANDKINGTIMTTEKPMIMASGIIMGIGWQLKEGNDGVVAACSQHSKQSNVRPYILSANCLSGDVTMYVSGGNDLTIGQGFLNFPPTLVEFDFSAAPTDSCKFFRAGSLVATSTKRGSPIAELKSSMLHIDLGGRYDSDNQKLFSSSHISCFYSIRGFTDQQAAGLTSIVI